MGYVTFYSDETWFDNSFFQTQRFHVEESPTYFEDSMSNIIANFFLCLKKSWRLRAYSTNSQSKLKIYEVNALPSELAGPV